MEFCRDVAWCHDCCSYSFSDEWSLDEEFSLVTVCPVCGARGLEMDGPLRVGVTASEWPTVVAIEAAEEHAVVVG